MIGAFGSEAFSYWARIARSYAAEATSNPTPFWHHTFQIPNRSEYVVLKREYQSPLSRGRWSEVYLVKDNVILSKDSRSHEKFMHGIKVLMAKNYIENLSEEVRKGSTRRRGSESCRQSLLWVTTRSPAKAA